MAILNDRIEHEIVIQAPPEVVFRFFTDPARHARWMGRAADLDPRPGGVYRVEVTDTRTVVGAYLHVDPPTTVSFTWGFENNPDAPPGSSTVTVELIPDGHATRLRLTHTGLAHPLLGGHDEGWRGYLAQLAALHDHAAAPDGRRK